MLIFTHITAPQSIIVLYLDTTSQNKLSITRLYLDSTWLHCTKPWQSTTELCWTLTKHTGQSPTWLHCTFTKLQDTPLFHTWPPHYTAFYTLPNHTLTSLLKTLQVSTVTAPNCTWPHSTLLYPDWTVPHPTIPWRYKTEQHPTLQHHNFTLLVSTYHYTSIPQITILNHY